MKKINEADLESIDFSNLPTKYVAFLDVLGFRQMVFSERLLKEKKLENYFKKTLREISSIMEKESEIEATLISDSIILSVRHEIGFLKILCEAVKKIQSSLALMNVWIRGGISLGQLCIKDELNVMVGQGQIRAYELEKQTKYPRVVIDPKIMGDEECKRGDFVNVMNSECEDEEDEIKEQLLFWKDKDALYVDYASLLFHPYSESKYQQIYDRLASSINEDQQHYHKYVWTREYMIKVIEETSKKLGNKIMRLQKAREKNPEVVTEVQRITDIRTAMGDWQYKFQCL